MGSDIFSLMLTNINGVPAMPVFIGNFLLDLLSSFFPLFIILSSFVMVYTAITRGNGDWKQTAQSVAPTTVSLIVILSLLSMKEPYEEKGLKGEFWENTNSYIVVDMMNTFLSFGNVFADALTHKMIYGSIKVTPGNTSFEGYFPVILQNMIENQKSQTKYADFLKNNNRDDIIDKINKNNTKLAINLSNYVEKLHNLGVVEDYRTVTPDNLEEFAFNRKRIISTDAKEQIVLNYNEVPQKTNDYSGNRKNMDNLSLNINGLNKPKSSTSRYLANDFILAANKGKESNENFYIYPEYGYYSYFEKKNNYDFNENVAVLASPDLERTFAYMYINNFELENDMVNMTKGMLNNYIDTYNEYDKVIDTYDKQSTSSKDQGEQLAYKNAKDQLFNEQSLIKGQIIAISKFYVSINNTINEIGKLNGVQNAALIDEKFISDINNILGDKYFESLDVNEVIKPDVLEALRDKASKMNPNDELFFGLTYGEYQNRVINNSKLAEVLNDRMQTKSYITNVIYDEFQEILKKDALFQAGLNLSTKSPYNKVFLTPNQFNTLVYKENKMNELMGMKNRNTSVAKELENKIKEQYSTLDTEFLHWTDLGKHYGTFKNLYSPMITNIVTLSEAKSLNDEKLGSLIQFMENMEPGPKSSRILNAGGVAGGVVAVTSIFKAALTKDFSSLSGLWEAIKIIGGVYFALVFVNVILPAFIWMFVIISYYVEMALYVAVFPIGFMFMIFQSYRQSLHQYINMLLGFILLPIILVSMYFIILYIDMMLPLFFKQFMPFFGSYSEMFNTFSNGLGETNSFFHDGMSKIFPNPEDVATNDTTNVIFGSLGNILYTILSMIMSSLLLMNFFRANDYMSKILNVNIVGMDSFSSKETLGRFSSLDKSGITKSSS